MSRAGNLLNSGIHLCTVAAGVRRNPRVPWPSLYQRLLSPGVPRSTAMMWRKPLFLTFCLCAVAYSQAPAINPQGLVNAATGKSASSIPVAARGSLVSIYGSNFSTIVVAANSAPIPTKLPGTETEVWFDNIAAPLLFVSPTQINAQVPFELPDASAVE